MIFTRNFKGINLAWPLIAISVFCVFGLLFAYRLELYYQIIDYWSFRPYAHPFIDSKFYIANKQCFKLGVPIYSVDPCDELYRVFSNSPLCLRLFFIPTNPALNPLFGGALCAGFFASLFTLPPIKGNWYRILGFLALLSPLCVFAVERGNLDLLMFAFATLAMFLWERGPLVRLLSYAVILFAFLTKFYPLGMMGLALRETPRVFSAVVAATLLTIITFVAAYHHELVLMWPNVPRPGPFSDGIGALQLIAGLAELAGIDRHIHIALVAAALACATLASFLTRNADFEKAIAGLGKRETSSLLTGALLLTTCFFAGNSIGYRGIYLLFALPSLIIMREITPRGGYNWRWRLAPFLALIVMWSPIFLRLAGEYYSDMPDEGVEKYAALAVWLMREVFWWWLITIFLAVILRFALRSQSAGKILLFLKKKKQKDFYPVGV